MLEYQLASFNARRKLGAGLAHSFIASYLLDVQNMAGYASLALKGGPEFNVVSPYPSYFQGILDTDPPSPPAYALDLYSSYFNLNVTTVAMLQTFGGSQNSTTILDNIMRPLKLDRPNTELLYFGFEDFGFRSYKYRYLKEFENRFRREDFCRNFPNFPKYGYVPACRTWYQNAQAAAFGKIVRDVGPPVISAPYMSASVNKPIITVSQAFYNRGAPVGVAGLDLFLESFLDDFGKHGRILRTGFTFLMSSAGNLITYDSRRLNGRNITSAVTNIDLIEFNDTAKLDDFLQLAMKKTTINDSSEITIDNKTWMISASILPDTDLLVVGLVPKEEVDFSGKDLRNRTRTYLMAAIATILVLFFVSTGVSYYFSRRFAMKVLNPVHELARVLDSITNSDLAVEINSSGGSSQELKLIHKHFQNLLIAVRFGNEAYYNGDLQLALQNYLAAEKLMEEFNNMRGLGICRNNLGNVYSQSEKYIEAEKAFEFAISNAIYFLSLETDPIELSDWDIMLANRMMNLGSLRQNIGQYAEAKELFNKAKEIFRKHDDVEGIAHVCGNYGQMLMDEGDLVRAQVLIDDAFDFVKGRSNKHRGSIALQYAMMNKGILCSAQGKKKEAIAWFLYVLQKFEVGVAYVQEICAQQVINLCMDPDVDNPEMARMIFAIGRTPFKRLYLPEEGTNSLHIPDPGKNQEMDAFMSLPKDLAFVLDVSGSMVGDFIRACRASLKEVIDFQTFPGDRIRFEKFSDVSTTVFTWTDVTIYTKREMKHLVDTQTDCDGKTALWDALMKSIYSFDSMPLTTASTVSSAVTTRLNYSATITSTTGESRMQWICALTDGFDNKSNTKYPELVKKLGTKNIGVIIIAVGELPNENILREICGASRGQGLFIRADKNEKAIHKAYNDAFRHISYYNVEAYKVKKDKLGKKK
ncbi:hypothetical protein HK098_004867 [Nowakowskiella sp. JEL0407]|nr:hypothetical protein HK098_004867 [Nowakowskiella sp. JEL0407]